MVFWLLLPHWDSCVSVVLVLRYGNIDSAPVDPSLFESSIAHSHSVFVLENRVGLPKELPPLHPVLAVERPLALEVGGGTSYQTSSVFQSNVLIGHVS